MTVKGQILERTTTKGIGPAAPMVEALESIARAEDVSAVVAAGRRLPGVLAQLVELGIDSLELGAASHMIDAMTRRLIDLALAELGEPPVPWAWLALGSAARLEQGVRTDQDHALAYDPQGGPLEELDEYFLRLAEFVTSGLEAGGIPRCNADVVATNHALRRPIEHWVNAFRTWMADSRIGSVRQTTILFDHRRVAGQLEAERMFGQTICGSPDRAAFVARLAEMAVEARPGWRVGRSRTIDLKHDVLMHIVSLGRVLAVAGRIPEPGTLARLHGATERGLLDEGTSTLLASCFRATWRIRLEHELVADAGACNQATLGTSAARRLVRKALGAIRGSKATLLRVSREFEMMHAGSVAALEPVA